MFNSLYSKIAAGLSVLFLAVGLIFIGITVFSTDMYQQEVNQKLNAGLAEQIVKERILIADGQVKQDALKDIFHMLMVINPGIEIYLLDPAGRILTYSAPRDSVKRETVDLEPLKQWLKNRSEAPLTGDDPKSLDRKKVFSAAPIVRNQKLEGYLYVILGGAQYDSVVQKLKGSYILQLSAWMIAGGLLFAMLTGLALFGILTGRLKKLASVMEGFRLGDGDLPAEFKAASVENQNASREKPLEKADEIERLSHTFRQMASRIEAQMQELKTSDQLRRELVANVSHDLKTPLATLQGYIETLLIKESQYSREERKHYLELAIGHCNRLNRLVSDLLDLARLESARMKILAEPFNVLELAQDVVQKFMLSAKKKQVSLETGFDGQTPLVKADISLIERVLENLIENAIRHTPNGGQVCVEILKSGKNALIQVKDTGKGISEKELKRIFERFYTGSDGNGKKGQHSGLGLAIAHKIIARHQSVLEVDSIPGQSSCFSFSLPGYYGSSTR